MFNQAAATKKLQEQIEFKKIHWAVKYHGVYLFRVEFKDPLEAHYDPFFSVDIQSGEVKDFSIMEDGDMTEIAALVADQNR